MISESERVLPPENKEDAPEFYWKMFDATAPFLSRFHRLKIVNPENIPKAGEGGIIIAAIHNGAIDGAFIAIAAGHRNRAIRFIGDEDICNVPVIGKMVREVGVIPIASKKGIGGDPAQTRQALAEAAEVIRLGGTLGIFPEGMIRPFFNSRQSFPFKTGVIRLSIATGAPVIPAWAQGAGAIFPWISPFDLMGKKFYGAIPFWSPTPVKVHFGEPFHVDKGITLESSAEEMRNEAERLRKASDELRNA